MAAIVGQYTAFNEEFPRNEWTQKKVYEKNNILLRNRKMSSENPRESVFLSRTGTGLNSGKQAPDTRVCDGSLSCRSSWFIINHNNILGALDRQDATRFIGCFSHLS